MRDLITFTVALEARDLKYHIEFHIFRITTELLFDLFVKFFCGVRL